MPFHIMATDHTGFTVANIERSLVFWQDVLGFELSHRAHHTGDLASEATGVPGAEISIAVLKSPGHRLNCSSTTRQRTGSVPISDLAMSDRSMLRSQ
jgi:catechol 2,3-dioxygenase-like lactoylglutathione lyase family enzyme